MLVACNGPLKGLLLHNLAALLVLHLGILVIRLHLHHLDGKREGGREGTGVTLWTASHLSQRSHQGHCDVVGLYPPGLSQTTQGLPHLAGQPWACVTHDSVFTSPPSIEELPHRVALETGLQLKQVLLLNTSGPVTANQVSS